MQIKRSLVAIIVSVFIAGVPLAAPAQVSVGIGIGGPGWGVGFATYAPPPLPVYSMPPAPYPGWQWIPGYWGWGTYGYYWVPGYWTAPPAVGLYWTPGYWGYTNGYYGWNPGYWGPTVGFYGGINYGFGYFGTGFVGGFWSGGTFNYNTAVVNVNRTVIRNTFSNRTVIRGHMVSRSRTSFNGGRRGVRARPTRAQIAARRHGVAETRAQRTHERIAARDRANLAAVNHGHPRVAAVQRPFSATHQPAHTHAITAADRAAAHRTVHGRVSAAVHQHASARHGTMTAATHHSVSARHGTMSAAVHHSSPMRHSSFSGRSFSHAGFAGRPAGGFSHGSFGSRSGGGFSRGSFGGRMSGGGGGGRGRPPHG